MVFNAIKKINQSINQSINQLDKGSILERKDRFPTMGHTITTYGIQPHHKKVKKIIEYPTSTNKKSTPIIFRSLSCYYSKFISDYMKIAFPLFDLTQKKKKFNWTQQQQQHIDSINLLKQKFITALVL